ncbi:MAG: AAA family ATPase [Pirellulaceae bacterium]
MKLARVQIENFRHLGGEGQPLVLDFTDAMGRVREFSLLVGPNTCGKTTILDAIAAAIGPTLQMPTLRRHFVRAPWAVVRRGALHAKVTCWLRFTTDEIEAVRHVFDLAELPHEVPNAQEVALTWEYPDPEGRSEHGYSTCEPGLGWTLLKGRYRIARLLSTRRVGWDWFEKVGGVFTFDQQRTAFAKTVSRRVWNIIHGTMPTGTKDRRTSDPKTILLDLAVRSLVPPYRDQQVSDFDRIKQRYSRVCAPHEIVGPIRDDDRGGLDILFSNGCDEYSYSGLSSGEQMVLLLLIRFVAEHMHQSIVLIDEIELNQHPIWQRKLLHLVPQMGDGNQIIATTHSPYLRDAVRPDSVVDLGSLDDLSSEGPQ